MNNIHYDEEYINNSYKDFKVLPDDIYLKYKEKKVIYKDVHMNLNDI